MKIDLTCLFNGSVDKVAIEDNVDLSNLSYSTYYPIKDGVAVEGSAYSKADVVYLELNVSFMFCGFCDRCAEKLEKEFSFTIERIVVEQLENEKEDDDYIIVKNRELDLDDLVNEEVALSLPNKLLCKDDCKGLCQKCGANLNERQCDCKSDIDPRMEALLQLLN